MPVEEARRQNLPVAKSLALFRGLYVVICMMPSASMTNRWNDVARSEPIGGGYEIFTQETVVVAKLSEKKLRP